MSADVPLEPPPISPSPSLSPSRAEEGADDEESSETTPVMTGTTLGGLMSVPAAKKPKKRKKNNTSNTGQNNESPSPSPSPAVPSSTSASAPSSAPLPRAAKSPPVKRSYVVKTHRDNEYSSEEEEDEEDYKRGGYHPVALGDVFARRYVVQAKLGWGHFSTVWLARDMRGSGTAVSALKIVKSAQHYTEAARDEVKILERLADPSSAHTGSACVIRLLDHFDVRGPHGCHVAMVFEKLGCNLLTLIRMYKYRGLPVPLVRHFAKQIVLGVAYLHKCRIVHTDLKPENLLLLHTPLLIKDLAKEDRDTSRSKTRESDDERESERVSLGDGENEEREDRAASSAQPNSPSLRLPWQPDELRAIFGQGGAFRLKIVDLGNACWFDRHFTEDVQTRQYRAPEVILGARFDEKIDVWSIACIVFELLTGELLFEPKSGNSYNKNDDHLAQMQELLGRMPRHISLAGRNARNYFNRRGELRYIKTLKFWALRDVLNAKYHFSMEDSQAISDFLTPMLHFEPSRRASAEEMLNAPWIKDIDVNSFESAFEPY